MSKVFVFSAMVATLIGGAASTPYAQCLAFSATDPCATARTPPLRGVTFATPPTPSSESKPLPQVTPMYSVVRTDVDAALPAVDCKMIRRVDPAFTSPMPVIRPDSTTDYKLKTMPVASCPP